MQNVIIRPTVLEDSEALVHIMIAAWRSAFRGILSDAVIDKYTDFDGCKAMFSQLLSSDFGAMYLAFLDKVPAGLLCLVPENPEEARIEALLTIPEAWGRGVGPALMETAFSHAKSAGFASIHVWPFAENHRARRFYEKWGFAPTGRERLGDAPEIEYRRST